jgi:glycine/D-amino acid oxidase-like deaminating enzyme
MASVAGAGVRCHRTESVAIEVRAARAGVLAAAYATHPERFVRQFPHPRLPGTVAPVATQLEDGRLLAGGTVDIGDESPGARQDVIDSILANLYAQLPELTGLCPSYQWCCFRPCHPDGYPVIGRLPGLDNTWLTTGHFRTGILMAPVTAQMIARWISASQPPPDAAARSTARFSHHQPGHPR